MKKADRQPGEGQTLENLSSEAMLQLIRELQLQNEELQRSRTELAQALRTKEALLEKADAQLAKIRQTSLQLAANDPLTGLPNRHAALKLLSKELARCKRHGEELAVGICSIDDFKAVNDTWGHQVGNEALCWLARTLIASVREYDAVARVGKERFLLIMPLKPGTDAESAFKRLCSQVANSRIETKAGELSLTISIGVAYAAAGSIVRRMLSEAGAALRHAKTQGCNRVIYFMKA